MKKTITMPALKPGMKEGILCRWNAAAGEKVSKGDILFEVETDKVVTEVEAEENCTVSAILTEEGDAAAPGEPLCEIEV